MNIEIANRYANLLTYIIDKKVMGNQTQVRLKTALESNALLQALISDYEVKAFNEELPSMHEIFNKTVTENH